MPADRPDLPEGYALAEFGDIDSTNLEAVRCANQGEDGPLWIRADRQLAGRGRLGRSWVSERGNLYSTLLLPAFFLGSAGITFASILLVVGTALRGQQAGGEVFFVIG